MTKPQTCASLCGEQEALISRRIVVDYYRKNEAQRSTILLATDGAGMGLLGMMTWTTYSGEAVHAPAIGLVWQCIALTCTGGEAPRPRGIGEPR